MGFVIGIAIGLAIAVITFFAGIQYRKKIGEAAIKSAEDEAKRIIDEAVKTGETKKKEALIEAKEEIIRNKNEAEREAKERRKEIDRLEKRAIQKEETLDKKIESCEKTEENYKTEKIGCVDSHFLQTESGKYYTLEFESIEKLIDFSDIERALKIALNNLLPKAREKILVVGLGNTEITSDSVGPITAKKILATRHITGQFAETIGLKNLKSVAVISPNVLGKTGIEVSELVLGAVNTVKPDAVIVIDALCSKSLNRLFSCIQLTDSGISPGSGVKNSRKELSKNTLGVPVVAIGVPTVVEA